MTPNATPPALPSGTAPPSVSTAVPTPTVSADAAARARVIRLVAFDVDGTMTDGAIHIGPAGEVFKRFSVRDGLGIVLLHRAGLRTAIITGRQSEIVAQRARELSIPHVVQGVKDKRTAMQQLCRQTGLAMTEIAFVGDDWPDLPAMADAGLAAAVANAAPEVRAIAHYIGTAAPGDGAVREFCEWLLDAQGRRDALLAGFRQHGEGSGHEGSGHEESGHDRPGHDRPGRDRPGHARPTSLPDDPHPAADDASGR